MALEIATELLEWARNRGGTLLHGTSGVGPVRAEVPCGARGLIRAVVGGLRSIHTPGRAEAREGVGCLPWPRGHEPGSAAQTRPALLGPGARRAAGRWRGFGAVGPGGERARSLRSCVDCGSGLGVGGLHCGLGIWPGRRVFERI